MPLQPDTSCPCCVTLGTLIEQHREALHHAELTRAAVEQAARKVDARHRLRSAIGQDNGDWRAARRGSDD
jgi:hypothetical protein